MTSMDGAVSGLRLTELRSSEMPRASSPSRCVFWYGCQFAESNELLDVPLLPTGLSVEKTDVSSRMEVDIPVVESGTLCRRGCFDKSCLIASRLTVLTISFNILAVCFLACS